ncbi:MAG: class I SAM-dependent methyltransferase [Actinobacteria bacterium]|nr:class I SAM-dependent methyltransferase [Actinomycetota bacterium]
MRRPAARGRTRRTPSGAKAEVVDPAAEGGFDWAAEEYERARPGYPRGALEHIVRELRLTPRSRVLDVAAGTGKLTRLLLDTGAHVVAVEPVAGMRRKLGIVCPDADVRDGRAEALPLPDESVDAVTAAQAFHWFDATAALAEFARVLRPGGGLALPYNARDRQVAWVRSFDEILDRFQRELAWSRPDLPDLVPLMAGAGAFTELQGATFPNSVPCTPDLLVALAASTSTVASLDDERRSACLEEVRALARSHPDLAGRDRFELPHVTYVFWCSKLPRS